MKSNYKALAIAIGALVAVAVFYPRGDGLTGTTPYERGAQALALKDAARTGYMTRSDLLYVWDVQAGRRKHDKRIDAHLLAGDVDTSYAFPGHGLAESVALNRGMYAQDLHSIGLTSPKLSEWERAGLKLAEATP
jgi:hypothetical protein